MWQRLQHLIENWVIEYSPFTDKLEVRDNRALRLSDEELALQHIGSADVFFEVSTNQPIMIVLPMAYEHLGDIGEDSAPADIAQRLVAYLTAHSDAVEVE